MSLVLRIKNIKLLFDKFRMVMISGKNDGLAQLVATLNLKPFLHNFGKNPLSGIRIKIHPIHFRGRNKFRHGIILGKSIFIAFLVLRGQFVVTNTFGRYAV